MWLYVLGILTPFLILNFLAVYLPFMKEREEE